MIVTYKLCCPATSWPMMHLRVGSSAQGWPLIGKALNPEGTETETRPSCFIFGPSREPPLEPIRLIADLDVWSL